MPQYINPYEGVGNALMSIGQNYDLDRRRKREAEEDQKRRRADFKWQMGLEEAAKEREYKRTAPQRELQQKIDMARLAKAEADAVSARIGMHTPKVINYPGAGGSEVFSPQFDAEGNVTGVQRTVKPFTPYPREPSKPDYVEGYDKDGNRTLFNPDTRETINTGMRGTAPPLLNQLPTPKELRELADKEFKALQAVDKMTPEELVPGWANLPEQRALLPQAIAAEKEKITNHYRSLRGEPPPAQEAAPRSPTALGAVGAIAKGAMGLMGNVANAVTPMTEQDVIDSYGRGEIDKSEMESRLSAINGTPVTTSFNRNPENKQNEKTETPSYEAAFAQVEAAFPDWPKKKIDAYLREKKGITPKEKK